MEPMRGEGEHADRNGYPVILSYRGLMLWLPTSDHPWAAPILHPIRVDAPMISQVTTRSMFCTGIHDIACNPTYIPMGHRGMVRGFKMPESEGYRDVNWNIVSSIRASKRRTQVIEALAESPRMNGELADDLGISTPWVRRQVKWLEERGLVEDLTESKPNYKLYGLTEDGEHILEVI